MTRLLIITFAFFTLHVSGQSDTLNQLNDKGKKNGYWLQYLDSMAYPTDSSNAYFYGYDLYDNGEGISLYSNRNQLWKQYNFVFDGELPAKGNPIPINGYFTWYKTETQLVNEEIYEDGKPLFWKSYQYTKKDPINPAYNEVRYFDQLYHHIPGTFYWEEYWNGKRGKTYWFRNGPKGWKSYRIKKDQLPMVQ